MKISFLINTDINHMVILRTPFINLITPYKVNHNGISFKHNYCKLLFPFLEQPRTRELNKLQAKSIYRNQINVLIQGKTAHLQNLKQEISHQKICKQLLSTTMQQRISAFQEQIEKEICADLPNAFWTRK